MYILGQIQGYVYQVTEWKVELQFSWSLEKKKGSEGDILVQALGYQDLVVLWTSNCASFPSLAASRLSNTQGLENRSAAFAIKANEVEGRGGKLGRPEDTMA